MRKIYLSLLTIIIYITFPKLSFAQSINETCAIIAMPTALPFMCKENGLTLNACDNRFRFLMLEIEPEKEEEQLYRNQYESAKEEAYASRKRESKSSKEIYDELFYYCVNRLKKYEK